MERCDDAKQYFVFLAPSGNFMMKEYKYLEDKNTKGYIYTGFDKATKGCEWLNQNKRLLSPDENSPTLPQKANGLKPIHHNE